MISILNIPENESFPIVMRQKIQDRTYTFRLRVNDYEGEVITISVEKDGERKLSNAPLYVGNPAGATEPDCPVIINPISEGDDVVDVTEQALKDRSVKLVVLPKI